MTSRLALVLGATLALSLPFGAASAPPAVAQEAAGAEEEIKSLAASVAAADDPQVAWTDAMRLVSFGTKAARPTADAAAGDATVIGRIALGRVLLQLRDRAGAAKALLQVASQADAPVDLRADAVRLLAQTSDDYEDAIRAIHDQALDGRLRAACSFTLWRLTKDPAWKTPLREMLRSDDPDLRIEGALALAEIGDFAPGVQEILQQVRVEPTDRGRLAAVLVEKEAWEKVRREGGDGPKAVAEESGLQPLLDEILRNLREVYVQADEIDLQKLHEGAAQGFVTAVGDAYTAYQDLDERDDWNDNLTKKYGGIGAYVGFDADGIFSITRPMYGGPAWNAKLKAGTRILRIDDWDTIGHSVDEIVKRLRGQSDTQVRILVQMPGWKEPQEKVLTRRPISVPTVTRETLPGKVGYLMVDNFATDTAKEFRDALAKFEKEGAEALVIDLRFNSGGYLHVVDQMADMLLPAGKLVHETKGRGGAERDGTYVSTGMSTAWSKSVPLTVLVNEFSASASEILSGCLKVHQRAKVVGTRTFGKGSVQNVFSLYTPPFAEPFVDRDGDREWDDAEKFADANANGRYDSGERYVDGNGNGRWDEAESYVDRNNNRRFDAPAVKVTIAKWFVSSRPGAFEFNPHRQEMIVSGRRVWLGGVEPDVPVASEEFEGWRAEEMAKLERANAFERYLGQDRAFFEQHKETFQRLALHDTRNPSDWPGFDDFYKSLDTKLTREEVWYWLHVRMRGEVSNEVGRLLVGDWVVDQQLQRAIRDLVERPELTTLRTLPEYQFVVAKAFDVPPTYDAEAIAKARPARQND